MSSLNEDSSAESLKFDSDSLLMYSDDFSGFNEHLAKDASYEEMEFSPDVYFPVDENNCELTQMTSVDKSAHCSSTNLVAQEHFCLNSGLQEEASLFSYEANTDHSKEADQVEENGSSHFECSNQQSAATEYIDDHYFSKSVAFDDNECSSSFENQQYFLEYNNGQFFIYYFLFFTKKYSVFHIFKRLHKN